ncbi:MAG TPA: tRNA pseudouridine(55) synthase TruB [Tenuifilaceae bacterium]|nr:tRNA pseudouridine(55) synthase TruB [Tenuifilaceae bacterium]
MDVNNFNATKEGTAILVDKPLGWTSFNVVGKIRTLIHRATGDRTIKVGHAGTLDPLATGLLVICTGRATKQIDSLMNGKKEYLATLKLGETTPSFDLETPPDGQFPTEHITPTLIAETLKNFMGIQHQTPPLFSAKYINGKRAYKYARKGIEVALEPVPIEIFEMEMLNFEPPLLTLRICCSKGTYIRALARDIGVALGSGAHLVALRRTVSGDFRISEALSIQELEKIFSSPMQQT